MRVRIMNVQLAFFLKKKVCFEPSKWIFRVSACIKESVGSVFGFLIHVEDKVTILTIKDWQIISKKL